MTKRSFSPGAWPVGQADALLLEGFERQVEGPLRPAVGSEAKRSLEELECQLWTTFRLLPGSLLENFLHPDGQRIRQEIRSSTVKNRNLSVRIRKKVVIEHQHMRQRPNALPQVRKRPWKARNEFLTRNIVPPLSDAHSHSHFGYRRIGNSDETKNHIVSRPGCPLKKTELITYRIRKDCLEDKALVLLEEFLSKSRGHFRSSIGIDL